MALASGVTLEIEAAAVPLLAGALGYAAQGAQPGGLKNNREFVLDCVAYERHIDAALDALLHDPQTSGGLLLATASAPGARIGRVVARREKPIHIL